MARLLRFQTVTFQHRENQHNHAYFVRSGADGTGWPTGVDVQRGARRWRLLWRLRK
jgi:hypothetical protein